MKTRACRRGVREGGAAFTLLELLVALAVLILLVMVLGSITSNVSSLWQRSREEIDNFSTARPLLDSLKRDLRTIVIRQDLPAFPTSSGSSAFAFYTRQFKQSSNGGNPRGLSYVSYFLQSGTLMCQTTPYDFTTAPQWSATNTDPNINGSNTPLCRNVYAFVYDFIGADGQATNTFSDPAVNTNSGTLTTIPTRAVRISLAILSTRGDQMLQQLGWQQALQSDLSSAVSQAGAGSPKAAWDQKLGTTGWGSQAYPSLLRSGISTYECVVPIDFSSPYVGPTTP